MKRKPLRRIFGAFTFIFFDRRRSLAFCLLFVAASWLVEIHCRIPSLFADSGAVVTLAGLFLNIKHSLHFHLNIPRVSLFNLLRGGGPLGELTVSTEDYAWVDGILADEMLGVAFMIAGTLIWAYGGFLIAWMGNCATR